MQETLQAAGQGHLWARVERLEPERRAAFLAQLQCVDWAELTGDSQESDGGEVRPADVIALSERGSLQSECVALGEAAYRRGEVAVLIVAGGQGTRLGFDGPKGCFPLLGPGDRGGPASIFDLLCGKVAEAAVKAGAPVPLWVMTSPHTDAPTRAFFAENSDFGLARGDVRFFSQGTVPTLSTDGRALLAAEDALLTNPDGHGGCFEALVTSGELARMQARGVRWLLYLQVDNVLALAWDPFAVGLAIQRGADALTKVLQKRSPDERVGHLVRRGERDAIVEYTELTAEQVRAPAADGKPLFRWGNTAMHCWSVPFLAGLAERGVHLPLHRSRKPVTAWLDGALREVEAVKSERFIFDLLAHANVSVGLEVDRSAEFAPVKNAEGLDSPQTAREALAAARV